MPVAQLSPGHQSDPTNHPASTPFQFPSGGILCSSGDHAHSRYYSFPTSTSAALPSSDSLLESGISLHQYQRNLLPYTYQSLEPFAAKAIRLRDNGILFPPRHPCQSSCSSAHTRSTDPCSPSTSNRCPDGRPEGDVFPQGWQRPKSFRYWRPSALKLPGCPIASPRYMFASEPSGGRGGGGRPRGELWGEKVCSDIFA
mgnify:CR=1 FL=1